MVDLLTHTTIWIEVPLMPLIYTMLQEALLFNLQIMIQDLSILINAQDSTARNKPVHDVLIKISLCYHRLRGLKHVHSPPYYI